MAAFWAAMGAYGTIQPCQGCFGGPLLRAARWVLACTPDTFTQAPNLFVDAAQGPGGYWVSMWNQAGPRIRRCPRLVTSQQSEEFWGVLAGLKRAQGPANLFVDNTGAFSTAVRGRACVALPEQQRIIWGALCAMSEP